MKKMAKDDPRVKTVMIPKSRLNPEPSDPVDWGRYALMGGGGLLGYSLAKQLLDDDEETKKKRSLLSKLFCAIAPFGAAYLGAKGLDMLANKIGPTKTSIQNGEGDGVEVKQIRLSDGKNYLFKSGKAPMTDAELASVGDDVIDNTGELTPDSIRRQKNNTYVWPYGVGATIAAGGAAGLARGAWTDFGHSQEVFPEGMTSRFSYPDYTPVKGKENIVSDLNTLNAPKNEINKAKDNLGRTKGNYDTAVEYHRKGIRKSVGAGAALVAAVASGWKAFENAKKIEKYQELAERYVPQE